MPPFYSSVTRINTAFPMISSVSAISSGVVCQFIDDVEGEINAKIAKRYDLPIVGTCPILVAIATRETIYRITVQRALITFPPAQQGQHPMQIQHKEDQALIAAIADGEIELVTTSGAVIGVDEGQVLVYSNTQNYNPTMTEGNILDEVVDPNKLSDILSDRGFA